MHATFSHDARLPGSSSIAALSAREAATILTFFSPREKGRGASLKYSAALNTRTRARGRVQTPYSGSTRRGARERAYYILMHAACR